MKAWLVSGHRLRAQIPEGGTVCSVTFSLHGCFSYSAVHLTQGIHLVRRMMGAGLNWLGQAAAGHRRKTGVLLARVLLGCLEHLPGLFPLFCCIGDIVKGPEKRPVGRSACLCHPLPLTTGDTGGEPFSHGLRGPVSENGADLHTGTGRGVP